MPSAIGFNAKVSYGATKFKYVDFKALRDAVLPVLDAHDLAVRYMTDNIEGNTYLVTRIVHCDGEVVNNFALPLRTSTKPQDLGSELTYFKRYGLAAVCGVVSDEDDDGNFADKAEAIREANKFINDEKIAEIKELIKVTQSNEQAYLNAIECKSIEGITEAKYKNALQKLKSKQTKMDEK